MNKIGIFGGTFNPIHNAHTVIADNFVNQLGLDACYFVPAYISPFRQNEKDQVTPADRLEMVKLAIEAFPKFQIEEFELNQKGVSYTINTILYFKEKFPDGKIYLLIGGDQAERFDNWYNWQEILYHAELCIAQRPLADYNTNSVYMKLAINTELPTFVDTPLLEISSSEIRDKIKKGEDITSMLSPKVAEYIVGKKLYL